MENLNKIDELITNTHKKLKLLEDLKFSILVETYKKINPKNKLFKTKFKQFEKNYNMEFIKPYDLEVTIFIREYIVYEYLKEKRLLKTNPLMSRPTNYELEKIKQIHIIKLKELN